MNFEGAYLKNGLADSTQIRNWQCPTPKKVVHKILRASVQGVLSYRCVKMAYFFYSCKIHTCLSCPRFLGPHNTLPCVLILFYTQVKDHTTQCDIKCFSVLLYKLQLSKSTKYIKVTTLLRYTAIFYITVCF